MERAIRGARKAVGGRNVFFVLLHGGCSVDSWICGTLRKPLLRVTANVVLRCSRIHQPGSASHDVAKLPLPLPPLPSRGIGSCLVPGWPIRCGSFITLSSVPTECGLGALKSCPSKKGILWPCPGPGRSGSPGNRPEYSLESLATFTWPIGNSKHQGPVTAKLGCMKAATAVRAESRSMPSNQQFTDLRRHRLHEHGHCCPSLQLLATQPLGDLASPCPFCHLPSSLGHPGEARGHSLPRLMLQVFVSDPMCVVPQNVGYFIQMFGAGTFAELLLARQAFVYSA